jgi:hypothetical protein
MPERTTAPKPDKTVRSVFPWFGSKAKVAPEVWKRLGNPYNYVEPFAGSLAVLLARPDSHQWWEQRLETVNDADGFVSNFHRAIAADPETVAAHASWPVNEADLTARHLWLVQNRQELTGRLMEDPDWFDVRAAGWWVWGVCAWVGGDWCTGIGPFTGTSEVSISQGGSAPGVYRKIPMISGGHGGKGIHRPRDVSGALASPTGTTVPDIAGSARAVLTSDFVVLANRLRRVRVACGNWDRVLGQAATPPKGHVTAVLLDPPYDMAERRGDLYGVGDRPEDMPVNVAARSWALDRTNDDRYRIAYCSYSTELEDAMFTQAGWTPLRWAALGGYGLRADNRARSNKEREIIWFSPSCLNPDDDPVAAQPLSLFDSTDLTQEAA